MARLVDGAHPAFVDLLHQRVLAQLQSRLHPFLQTADRLEGAQPQRRQRAEQEAHRQHAQRQRARGETRRRYEPERPATVGEGKLHRALQRAARRLSFQQSRLALVEGAGVGRRRGVEQREAEPFGVHRSQRALDHRGDAEDLGGDAAEGALALRRCAGGHVGLVDGVEDGDGID